MGSIAHSFLGETEASVSRAGRSRGTLSLMEMSSSPLWYLAKKLGREWPHLRQAHELSLAEYASLETLIAKSIPEDTSFVVFGSLARGEYTQGSDLDWTLLVDGRTDMTQPRAARDISASLQAAGKHPPGPTGMFGNLSFGHHMLHQIGGADDTNRNTTQRILMLLESQAVGRAETHERVLRHVLARYIEDDRGLLYSSRQNPQLVPRVLLNDIARYWRTITIDFVSKQHERPDGWALRNIKLRMSRKLIYVSGLLTCFAPNLHAQRDDLLDVEGRPDGAKIAEVLFQSTRLRPLDNLANTCLLPSVRPETALALFDNYDEFLGELASAECREELKRCKLDELGTSEAFRRLSRIASRFQEEGVHKLFFEDDKLLQQLILRFGVF